MNALFRAIIVAVLAHAGCAVAQQAYPDRQITIIAPFPPGAVTDIIGRVVAEYIRTRTGRNVVVDNRPGAAGNLGTALVARANPDGYTLGIISNSTTAINPHLYRAMPFEPLRDLAIIGTIGEVPSVIAVRTSFPAQTLGDFVTLAKQKPRQITFGSSGSGSPLHLGVLRWANIAGLELNHVPYQGAAAAVTAVLAGQVDMVETGIGLVIAHVKAGELKLLAIDGPVRLPAVPETPIIADFGVPDGGATTWFGLAAPRATPPAVIDTVSGWLRDLAADPVSRKRLTDASVDVVFSTPAEAVARIQRDDVVWGKVIDEGGVRLD